MTMIISMAKKVVEAYRFRLWVGRGGPPMNGFHPNCIWRLDPAHRDKWFANLVSLQDHHRTTGAKTFGHPCLLQSTIGPEKTRGIIDAQLSKRKRKPLTWGIGLFARMGIHRTQQW